MMSDFRLPKLTPMTSTSKKKPIRNMGRNDYKVTPNTTLNDADKDKNPQNPDEKNINKESDLERIKIKVKKETDEKKLYNFQQIYS